MKDTLPRIIRWSIAALILAAVASFIAILKGHEMTVRYATFSFFFYLGLVPFISLINPITRLYGEDPPWVTASITIVASFSICAVYAV